MLRRVWRWWHAAEEDAIVIFPMSVGPLLAMQVVLLAAFLAVFRQARYRSVFGAVAVVVGLRTIADRRRAIIFSSSELIFRPVFGPPSRVRLSDITDVKKTTVSRSFALRPNLVPGVELTLSSGEKLRWSLDFPRADEIMERLRSHVAAK